MFSAAERERLLKAVYKQTDIPDKPRNLVGMAKDIPCQQNKIHTHVKSLVPSIPVPVSCFAHIHIDLVGPLPSASGQSYILTMIDAQPDGRGHIIKLYFC